MHNTPMAVLDWPLCRTCCRRWLSWCESLVLYVLFYPLFKSFFQPLTITYDHRCQRARDPVRSPLDKLATAGSVLRSVTTGESPVLYVFFRFVSTMIHPYLNSSSALNLHIRPYLRKNTGSRPLSPRQIRESQTSSWVGDDQRIPGVVCFCLSYPSLFGVEGGGCHTFAARIAGWGVETGRRISRPWGSCSYYVESTLGRKCFAVAECLGRKGWNTNLRSFSMGRAA